MKSARFFVTAVVLFATLISMGCGDKKKAKTDPAKISALRNEGKATWEQCDVLTKELGQNYRIILLDQQMATAAGAKVIDSAMMGQKFNWNRLTLAQRQGAKEKLAQVIAALNRVIAIDAQKGVYVTHMNKVRSRYAGALAFQNSLFNFERVSGESYDPPAPGQGQFYFSPVDI